MRKGITKVGNSYGIILDKAILELLHIGPDTDLELTTDGRSLTLTPIRPVPATAAEGGSTYGQDHTEAVRAAAREVVEIYADTFRKLAQ